jgi:alpha-tubulin suppressor-like RCC1 family protein
VLPERARDVAAGMYFSLALGLSGRVYAFGWNRQGQLATGDRDDRRMPVRVASLEKVRAIAAGQAHAAALTDQALVGWGSNVAGQLGTAAQEQLVPTQLLATNARGRHV